MVRASALAVRAEVGGALQIALAYHLDRCGAAQTRLALAVVHPMQMPGLLQIGWRRRIFAIPLGATLHQRSHFAPQQIKFSWCDARSSAAWINPRQKQAF